MAFIRAAAEQGYPIAQNDLGRQYELGAGVAKDDAEALRLYRVAAESGYALAFFQLEADGIGGEGSAGQPRPFDRALAFLDPLFSRAALVVEGNHALRWPRQVGHDKADTWIQFAWVPLDPRLREGRLLATTRRLLFQLCA